MRLSWSQQLFLRLNRQIGASRWVDETMLFLAHYCIYLLGLGFVAWLFSHLHPGALRPFTVALAGLAFFFCYLVSYAIALLWRHERPVRELRRVRQLFEPFGTWKAFPSDHTIAVTIIAIVVFLTGGPWWIGLIFSVLGVGVAIGRVYAGVHYPRDIIGGWLIGTIGTLLAYQILYPWFLLFNFSVL